MDDALGPQEIPSGTQEAQPVTADAVDEMPRGAVAAGPGACVQAEGGQSPPPAGAGTSSSPPTGCFKHAASQQKDSDAEMCKEYAAAFASLVDSPIGSLGAGAENACKRDRQDGAEVHDAAGPGPSQSLAGAMGRNPNENTGGVRKKAKYTAAMECFGADFFALYGSVSTASTPPSSQETNS